VNPKDPSDDRAADVYGRIRANLEQRGQAIGPNDTMIAAIALANGLTIVTHDTAEFSRVSGLLIEDWHTSTPLEWNSRCGFGIAESDSRGSNPREAELQRRQQNARRVRFAPRMAKRIHG